MYVLFIAPMYTQIRKLETRKVTAKNYVTNHFISASNPKMLLQMFGNFYLFLHVTVATAYLICKVYIQPRTHIHRHVQCAYVCVMTAIQIKA